MSVIGLDDVLNQPVTHHILLVEIDEPYPLDTPKDLFHFDKTGHSLRRQIDLRDISGH